MARAYYLSAEERPKRSERMKRLHADPAFEAKLAASHRTPEFRATASERMKRLDADPNFAAKQNSPKQRGRTART